MALSDLTAVLCDLLGTAAFALSGAMVACHKRADLFGILFLGVITALGGGMLRDLILGLHPPALFFNRLDVSLAVVMGLLVFFLARYHKGYWVQREEQVERLNNVVDALGLGFFAVTGCLVTIEAGYGNHWFLTVSMGLTTAVGGGLLRDLILREIPFILKKHIYAVAALAGALSFYLLYRLGLEELGVLAGVCVTFALRLLATHFRWNLPHP